MKQHEFAKKIGISQNHLSQIESGKRKVSIALLDKIAEAFSLGYDELLREMRPIVNSPDDFGKVFKWIREQQQISIEAIADRIGETPATLEKWEKKGSLIDSDKLEIIADALNVSLDYVYGIEDDPTPVDKPPSIKTVKDERIARPENPSGIITNIKNIPPNYDLMKIPLFSKATAASCGVGNSYYDVSEEAEDILLIARSSFAELDDLRPPFATYADGDSMENAGIEDGSQVLINPAESVHSGDVACVWWDGRVAIKWVMFQPDGSVELRSANVDYQPIKIDKEYVKDTDWFRIIGRVVLVIVKPRRAY